MLYRAGSGHLGGSLSATDILVALFFGEMRAKADDSCWVGRDRFILSKGHGAPAYYAILARLGIFPGRNSLPCASSAASFRVTLTPAAPRGWRFPPAL